MASVLIWALRRGERFLTYTVDATARKAGDAISDTISARLRSWLENFNRHRSQDDRAVTSEIIVNVDPQIILITTGQHTEQQTDIGIQSLTKHLELWESLLHKADSITFVRESKNEEWIFLHMTTSDGKVIAAEDSYLRTITRREEIARTKPVCVYLKHKVTGEERHHETTAVFTKVDEAGRFEVKFNSFPQDLEHWEITGYSLLSDTRTTPKVVGPSQEFQYRANQLLLGDGLVGAFGAAQRVVALTNAIPKCRKCRRVRDGRAPLGGRLYAFGQEVVREQIAGHVSS